MSIIYKFFKDFTTQRKKTNRKVVFCHIPFPNILKYMDHRWDLSTIWRTRFFQTHIEEFSFKTTTGIQSGPDTFKKSRSAMTFLINLGVTEILCYFRLVLEGKTGKEIPESSRLEFLEKFLTNNFTLSDVGDNTSMLLNRGGVFLFFIFNWDSLHARLNSHCKA